MRNLRETRRENEHVVEGINSRMDGLQAAILNVKMNYLHDWTEERKKIAMLYSQGLSKVLGLICPNARSDCDHVYHLYVIQHEKRDALKASLEQTGISTVLNYPKALPFYQAYRYLKHSPSDFPSAHNHQTKILSLPLFPYMKNNEINYVIRKIQEFAK